MNEIINEILEEQFQPGFFIDTADRASWALEVLKRDKDKADEYVETCQKMMAVYQGKIDKMLEKTKNDANFLGTQLRFYFDGQKHETTKTQSKLVLPSGTLLLKKASPKYIRDETALVNWMCANGCGDFVKTILTPKWDELKKDTKIVGKTVVQTSSGLVVEGVTVEPGEDNFQVIFEVKE